MAAIVRFVVLNFVSVITALAFTFVSCVVVVVGYHGWSISFICLKSIYPVISLKEEHRVDFTLSYHAFVEPDQLESQVRSSA